MPSAAALAGVIGLALGSFFTVLIERWPAGRSLIAPRSSCDRCGRILTPLELVPILSWVALRGRCRGCGARVDARYAAVELLTGALAAGAIVAFGPTWRGLAVAVLLVALVPVIVIDLRHRLIPDIVVLPAAAVGLAAAVAADPGRWWVPVASAAGAAGFLALIGVVRPGGMGMGDAKLGLLLGAVLGSAVVPALAAAFAAGALIGLALMAARGAAARRMAVPFGPFLSAGALVALVWGHTLIDWYQGQVA
jgi:prepilin signal peptidase PulO-like enzyme (type II secretory pathway)